VKEIRLVRHAESLANAGAATSTPKDIPLSEKGHEQARALADSIVDRPDRIVLSPYVRTQETARPLLTRFPDTPVETLSVQEFTYLAISRCRNTTREQRRPMVEEYWSRSDPFYCDGDQAESLAELIYRTRDFLRRLHEMDGELIFVFTHEQFIKAVIWEVLQLGPNIDAAFMAGFYKFSTSFTIPNAGVMKMLLEDGEFTLGRIIGNP
jgi:2,3-bisphosphoglycerate-dependent phosphoglycerate mutase